MTFNNHASNTSYDEERFSSPPFTDEDAVLGWPDPDLTLLGTNRRPAPAFPVQLLGPFWSAWASRAAEGACAPVDYCAASLLAAVGASIANVRRPLAGRDWSEPPAHVGWPGRLTVDRQVPEHGQGPRPRQPCGGPDGLRVR